MLKKYITLFVFLLMLFPSYYVFALSSEQKGAIMEKFKQKQYDLLFESDLGSISSQYSEVFNVSKKVDIYNTITDTVEKQRLEVERKKNELVEKITTLEEAIKLLDKDIIRITSKIKQVNNDIIETKGSIKSNEKTINILKGKIEENRKILLEYLVYIYKKGNTGYSDEGIDNIKTILLNGEEIGDYINDLYFKGIIQVTGKKLLDNHKKFVSELYLKKVSLEKQEINLKRLRKESIIEKKVLNDKKDFKKRILTVSKGKQEFYEKFVKDKIKTENNLRLRSFKENIKFNSIRNKILGKYDCKYVDISKNTAEVRALTSKCYDINKLIFSESKLKNDTKIVKDNFLRWPVNPYLGISAFYKDKGYLKTFGSDHDALDIVVPQGTSIEAAASGYVVYLQKPTTEDYAYVALKHHNGYVTVYGHVSEVLVDEFDYVEAGEIFAKSGGEFGTKGAGFMTTGAHLHLEVFKDKKYIDPLTALDLSYIKYPFIPAKYKIKYYSDFRSRKGYEFKDKTENSRVFKLEGSNEIERQKYLLNKYAVGDFRDWQVWVDEALDGNIDPSFAMCIGLAETTLGKHVKTPYNIGNVGNTDSGATKTFPNARSGIYWMIQTLNNRYLGQYDELHLLSRYGNKNPKKPIYASSPDNWHNNNIKCLSHLKGTYVPDDFNFRLIK